MVSKRKTGNEDEPGPSKKQRLSEDETESQKKVKKARKPKKKIPKKEADEDKDKDVETDKLSDTEIINNNSEINIEKSDESIMISHDEKPHEVHPNINSDIPNWPINHMSELLRKIENVLPQKDNLVYKSRCERIDWNEIAFEDYTGAQCRIMWEAIQKRLRRFRILQELIEDAKVWISKPWTNFYRGSKTNRHPDMPRRPLTTYMLFYMKKKDKVLKENPGLEMTGLSKHIAEMYKKLPPKTKEKYNEMATQQRREYEVKLKEFYRNHPDLAPSTVKSGNVNHVNDPLLKKPATPFKMFCEDKMKKHKDDPNFDKIQFIGKCKEQWRNMSDKKKVFWINWASERELKYQENVKKYVAENPDYVPNATKSILTKDERILRERMAGKPEKPPNSAYSLFSRLMLASEDVKSVSPKERMLVIAQQWKNCNELEKKEYADRVKHMLEQYKLQYAEYLESLPEDKRQEELLNNQPKKKKVSKPKAVNPSLPTPSKPPKVTKSNKKQTPLQNKSDKTIQLQQQPQPQQQRPQLFEGEPEQPPATPYLLFVKTYEANNGNAKDAHEVWKNMSEEQRSIHRRILWDMKKLYIESYENFLKGLTPEELKEYSEWKKNFKTETENSDDESDDDDKSDDDNTCSDDECNLSKVKSDSSYDSSSCIMSD